MSIHRRKPISILVAVILLTLFNRCALLSSNSLTEDDEDLSDSPGDSMNQASDDFPNTDTPASNGPLVDRSNSSSYRSSDPDRTPAQDGSDSSSQPLRNHRIQNALDRGEITLGMKMSDVISAWGHPGEIEKSGNPIQGNQKWIYLDSSFSRWSLIPPRIVYFEKGRVVGWENARP